MIGGNQFARAHYTAKVHPHTYPYTHKFRGRKIEETLYGPGVGFCGGGWVVGGWGLNEKNRFPPFGTQRRYAPLLAVTVDSA